MVNLFERTSPFFEALTKYGTQNYIPFHTPGHRGGVALGTKWQDSDLLKLDLTELSGLDWSGARARAEESAAEFYQADRSFFLVQGATQGIHAALLGCFNPGDAIFVGRNCHISVYYGLILADLRPIFIEVDWLSKWGLPAGLNIESLRRSVAAYPEAKGLIVTNPTYQGVATRLAGYREIIGERLLVVDEAHGGYFQWWGAAGYDACEIADLWVHGTHKLLGSLTQTGMLHLREGRVDPEKLSRRLDLLTTTSPSYLLLASLDLNRAFLADRGRRLFERKLATRQKWKAAFSNVSGVAVLTDRDLAEYSGRIVDPWKLSLSWAGRGFTGFEMDRIFREEYAIQAEYADLNQMTFFIPPWQATADLRRLKTALHGTAGRNGTTPSFPQGVSLEIPPLVIQPREAALGPVVNIRLEEAAGKIAAEVLAPYPPGIPLVAPGERISQAAVETLQQTLKAGGNIHGMNQRGEILISCIGVD